MAKQQSPSRRRPDALSLRTPQDFELRKPVATVSQTSMPRTSSFASLSQASSVQLIDQSDQFFIIPGLDGALSREEFSKLTPTASPEKGRHAEASFVEMAAARQSLCDLAEVARRKEQEWRTLQELRIRGLEDAVQGREQSLQQERRRFQRTVDELTQQRRQLEQQLGASGARAQDVTELRQDLEQAQDSARELAQERDALHAKLADIISKQDAVETAAQQLREENERLAHRSRALEKEAQAARRSGDWMTKRLQSTEQERERSADAELQMKVTIGKMEGYLKEEENTLEVVRAELNNAKEAKETVEVELKTEKTRLKEYQDRTRKLDTEWTVSRVELESQLADKTKKIGFLVQGIRTLETDWKERYGELQRTSAGALDEVERSHSAEQERLLTLVRSGDDRARHAAAQAAASHTEAQRLSAELTQAAAAAAAAGRERADERREAAQLLAARELNLAELRAQTERQELHLSELVSNRPSRDADKLNETRRLLAQWQAACARLREYAERVTTERDRLQKSAAAAAAAAPVQPTASVSAPAAAGAQLERDNARLRGLVRRLRDELEQRQQQQREAASPHCSSCSSADDARALQLRQLLLTNAKLNETITAQSETVRATQAELERHRAAARSTQFLRQETAYLRSLLDGGDGTETGRDGGGVVAVADDASAPASVRELRYKLQLAARYIAHLGRERAATLERQQQLERRLAAAQRAPSLPSDLDRLRVSARCCSPAWETRAGDQAAVSFAELLDQLNSMQVDTECPTGDAGGRSYPAGTQTSCRHVLSAGCRHGYVAESDELPHVPRLVGLGDCRSPGAEPGSSDERSSSVTVGTGDGQSTGEGEVVGGRARRSRSAPHKRRNNVRNK